MYGLKELSDVHKVKIKCKGCGATITICVMEGESASEIIVGCDRCNKNVQRGEWDESN